MTGYSSLSVQQQAEAARRVADGEALEAVARDFGVTPQELRRSVERWQRLVEREAAKEARKVAVEVTREAWVEQQVRAHLTARGYVVETRHKPTGPDIVARKDGRTLQVEVKGDRPGHISAPGTINVDVMTLLGQIVMAKAKRMGEDYAVAVRPVHMRLLRRALPVLKELGIETLLVGDDGTVTAVDQ